MAGLEGASHVSRRGDFALVRDYLDPRPSRVWPPLDEHKVPAVRTNRDSAIWRPSCTVSIEATLELRAFANLILSGRQVGAILINFEDTTSSFPMCVILELYAQLGCSASK